VNFETATPIEPPLDDDLLQRGIFGIRKGEVGMSFAMLEGIAYKDYPISEDLAELFEPTDLEAIMKLP